MVNPKNLILILKWTKTLQSANQGTYIVLPRLKNPLLCPWQNFHKLNYLYPVSKNSPCFASNFFIVTESTLRKHLKILLSRIGLDPMSFGFHAFRRSGATLAYNLDVKWEDIKRHGTWRSDAVNSYIVADAHKATGVASSFKTYLDST